jgi:hypothetical protein|eukprot:247738_1
MVFKLFLPFILFAFVSVASLLLLQVSSGSKCPIFECPTDDSIDPACLDSAIPPWPICKFGTVDDFVSKAKDGATRCCGDDISECKCPKKDTDAFLDKITSWCDGVSKCPSDTTEDAAITIEDTEDAVHKGHSNFGKSDEYVASE